MKILKYYLVVQALLISVVCLSSPGPLSLSTLRIEYLKSPAIIDVEKPRFSWNFVQSDQRAQLQTAYEIIVSTDQNALAKGQGDAWSSGIVESSESVNIEYQGKALQSTTTYYWKVRVRNQNNEWGPWSDAAIFETAFLSANEWTGKWISDGSSNPAVDSNAFKPDRMPLFRRQFSTMKKIASARLYVSGVGYFEAYLNGKKIGDHLLSPGWTTYAKEVQYEVHDVTTLLKNAENVLAVMLGNGWRNPLPIKLFGRWDIRDYQETSRPCLKAEIHLVYHDGTREIIGTDASWKTAPGPVYKNSVYLGEHYDARLEQKSWNSVGTLSNDWKSAILVSGPSGKLSYQMQPPIRVTKTITPKKILQAKRDTFIVDFGQNFAGVVQLKVKGKKGQKVTVRYGEALFKDNTLNYHTTVMTQIRKGGIPAGPGAPPTAWQEDSYTLKGEGVEIWSPRFTFHGFRYAEVTGWPGTLSTEQITGLRMNSDLEDAGNFECANPLLNDVQRLAEWTFLSNVFSVQSDCPAREKLGYGADIVVTGNAFIYNYDMSQFYRKTVRDFANEQLADGGITEIAPFTGIADRGYGGNSGPLGWQLAFPFIQKQLYDFYGDKRVIEANYEGLKKQISFLKSHAVQGLYHWDIGDHEALDPRAEAFSAATFYYHHLQLAAEFASVLNKNEDAARFARDADEVKKLIVKKYWVPETGRFDNATQAAQIFALWYGLTPEENLSWNVLMEEFKRHQWHVSSGIFGVKMMFDVLRERNEKDLAYKIAAAEDYPGWGHMVKFGATTLWESWEYPEMYASQNHPMFGSISEWFYRSLGGINPESPGFKTILIHPQIPKDLAWARANYKSIRGEIVCSWRKNNNELTVEVEIPVNTSATIVLPGRANAIEEADPAFRQNFKLTENIDNTTNVLVGSGKYQFKIKL